MAVNIGSAVFDVQADTDPAKRSLRRLGDDSKGSGRRIGSRLASGFKTTAVAGFKVAGMAAAAGAVAAIGIGFKGIQESMGFNDQMREVFTLLPDISEDAMSEMKDQVKDFATEFGVLPKDTIPALYQAISAGVPKDNVFDFLETAQQAAKGGVTDLETAVDGLSSVTNAYGSDVLDAQKASDLMFTAVRLGKCLRGDQRVVLADGTYRRIDELSDGGTVVAYDGRGLVTESARWVYQGRKRTVTMTTRLGRRIVTTWNHPYLVQRCRHGESCQRHTCKRDEWVNVSDLRIGDRVAVPTHIPVEGSVSVEEHRAGMLGLWLAEGSNQLGSVNVTTAAYRDEIERWGKEWGLRITGEDPAGKATTYRLTKTGGRDSRPNPLTDWFRSLGLGSPTTKHVPDEVFRWDRASTATFLRWLFNGDGWLADLRGSGRSGFQLGFCSKDEQLVRDISHLLLRFGIVGRVRERSDCSAWVWETNRWSEVDRFVRLIGIDRPAASTVADHQPEKQRRRMGQLEFDPIVSIEEGDPADVYDLIVPNSHNFIAEDVLAHNTDLDQLSKSLFQVTPTAAGLGVGFGDVTAAMATMTSQGVPTQVASTQMRQMFVELSKAGGETANTFEAMSGKTFQEFIAEGGNTADALAIMQDAAAESGDSIQDMFGSVEAGQAALALTGRNAEGFRDNIAEMGASSGATQTAFETMNQGFSLLVDRLKAIGTVALISIGEFLIPKIMAAADFIEEHWPTISAVFLQVRDVLGDVIEWLVDNVFDPLIEILGNAVEWVQDNWTEIVDVFEDVRDEIAGIVSTIADVVTDALGGIVDWVRANWSQISAVISTSATIIWNTLRTVGDAFITAFQWVIDNKPVLIGVATAIGVGLVAMFTSWAISAGAAAIATAAAAAPFIAIGAVIAAVVAGVIVAYQEWDAFRAVVDAVREWMVNTLWPAIQDVFGWLRDNVPPILQTVADFWSDVLMPAIEAVWNFISGTLWPVFREFGTFLAGAYVGYVQAVVDIVTTLWDWLQTLWDRSEGLRAFLVDAFQAGLDIATTAFGAIRDSVEAVWSWLQTLWDRAELFRAFLADAFQLGVETAEHAFDGVQTSVSTLWGWIQVLWDRSEMFRVFMEGVFTTGIDIAAAAIDGIRSAISQVWGWTQVAWDRLEPFRAFMEGAFSLAMRIVEAHVRGVAGAFLAIAGAVRDAVGWIDKLPSSLPSWVFGTPSQELFAPGGDFNPGNNAMGTSFWKGGLTWVGENGPEIVNLPRGSQVFDAQASARMGDQTSFSIGDVIVNVDARGAADPQAVGDAAGRGTLEALARYRQARGS